MATEHRVKQGLTIRLTGRPSAEIREASDSEVVSVFPASDWTGIKQKLMVREGDIVQRGTPLVRNKGREEAYLCSPAAGTVEGVTRGPRMIIEEIRIRRAGDVAVSFPSYTAESVLEASREDLVAHLEKTGYLQLFVQRPFSRTADAAVEPKSIFVNGMRGAPFRVDPDTAVMGREGAFQAGLNALTRLTSGKVFLAIDTDAKAPGLTGAANVDVHAFSGPHPAGNTSTHIHTLDPISPGDSVWTIRLEDVVLYGELLLNGQLPTHKIVAAGGPELPKEQCAHYRIRIGASIATAFAGELDAKAVRVVRGDVLAGDPVDVDSGVSMTSSSYVVLKDDKERHFLGWMAPGLNKFTSSKAFVSPWIGGLSKEWALGTNRNGSLRAMVLTGKYDKVVPLNIMVDYLVRACIAHDTEDAVNLGILGTDPEDFALCSVICPSKTDFSFFIQRALNEIEKEGL